MNAFFYHLAGETIAGEPVSVEPDGAVWVDSDGRIIESAMIQQEITRLEAAAVAEQQRKEAARASAIAKLAALGLDADEVSAVIGGAV